MVAATTSRSTAAGVGRTSAHPSRMPTPIRRSANLTDEHLAAAAAGDTEALREIYDRLSSAVHGYLKARGVRDPDDVTSEVFLAVFTRLDTVTGGIAGLRTLTFSVAHARLVDDIRRRDRRPDEMPYEPEVDVRVSDSAETVALADMQTSTVTAVLARLPDDYREVLLLRVLADLSVDQTAAVMQRSTGSVKQLQRRALIALRTKIVEKGVTP